MELVATTVKPGWIKQKFHDYSTDEMLPSQAVDRLQEDSALLSDGIVSLHVLYHYPIIATATHQMGVVASSDTITLEDNIIYSVGGMVFDTHWLDSRTVTIPDNSTRFLRAEVDEACGDLVDYGDPSNGVQVDPLTRKLVCKLLLVEGAETDPEGVGGGPSSPTSMRILKAVKGAAGSVPVVTLYANDGRNPANGAMAEHEAADPAHPAAKIGFDNTSASLAGDPSRVQPAIEALATLARSVAAGTQGIVTSIITAAPVDLYVDAAVGDDTAAGDQAHPLKTLAAAVAVLPAIIADNTTIHLATGSYADATINRHVQSPAILSISGNPAAPANVKMTGVLTVENSRGLVIDGLELSNTVGYSVVLQKGALATLRNCSIVGHGISVKNARAILESTCTCNSIGNALIAYEGGLISVGMAALTAQASSASTLVAATRGGQVVFEVDVSITKLNTVMDALYMSQAGRIMTCGNLSINSTRNAIGLASGGLLTVFGDLAITLSGATACYGFYSNGADCGCDIFIKGNLTISATGSGGYGLHLMSSRLACYYTVTITGCGYNCGVRLERGSRMSCSAANISGWATNQVVAANSVLTTT